MGKVLFNCSVEGTVQRQGKSLRATLLLLHRGGGPVSGCKSPRLAPAVRYTTSRSRLAFCQSHHATKGGQDVGFDRKIECLTALGYHELRLVTEAALAVSAARLAIAGIPKQRTRRTAHDTLSQ